MSKTCFFAIREFKLLRLMNRELHIRNPLTGIRLMMIKPFFHSCIYLFIQYCWVSTMCPALF